MAEAVGPQKHIIRDLPQSHREAYSQFFRSPCMMANIALRNWRFLAKLGITGCRWFGSNLGNYLELRRLATIGDVPKNHRPDSPVVLTLKVLYSYPGFQHRRSKAIAVAAKCSLLLFANTNAASANNFTDMFSSAGFDASRDIAGIILNRWGHAYLSPQPGSSSA